MSVTPEQLLARLDELGIVYQYYQHPAVYTVEQAQQYCGHIPGGHCKNLFLRNKKKRNWLLVLKNDAFVDLKLIGKSLGAGNLGFASQERLDEVLGVIPGAVTPLALINDRAAATSVVIDRRLMDYEVVNFHPLVNTATLSIAPADLLVFVRACGHEPQLADFAGLGSDTRSFDTAGRQD